MQCQKMACINLKELVGTGFISRYWIHISVLGSYLGTGSISEWCFKDPLTSLTCKHITNCPVAKKSEVQPKDSVLESEVVGGGGGEIDN